MRNNSEDKDFDTIEFNEFLEMMNQHEKDSIANIGSLIEAFEVFDLDASGLGNG